MKVPDLMAILERETLQEHTYSFTILNHCLVLCNTAPSTACYGLVIVIKLNMCTIQATWIASIM